MEFFSEGDVGGNSSNSGNIFTVQKKIVRFEVGTRPRRGHAVAQLVEALRYKPEDRGFDSQ